MSVNLKQAIMAKLDRIGQHPRIPKILPMLELSKGAWYVGHSRQATVALWDGEAFVSVRLATDDNATMIVFLYHTTALDLPQGFAPVRRVPSLR